MWRDSWSSCRRKEVTDMGWKLLGFILALGTMLALEENEVLE